MDVMEGDQIEPLPFFYFRQRSGHEIAISMLSMQRIDVESIIDRESLREKCIRRAADLLESEAPRDLQTAAIHLGQLRSREHVPALKKLIENPGGYILDVFGSVAYIREAAETAIQLIEEAPRYNQHLVEILL